MQRLFVLNTSPRVIAFTACLLLAAASARGQRNVGYNPGGSASLPSSVPGATSYNQPLFAPPTAPSVSSISRPSTGGQRAAAPVNSFSSTRYNVKTGPVQMDYSASMGAAYNSNVNLSNDDPTPDLILTPRVGMGVYWPITRLNTLSIDVSLGYNYYLNEPDLGGQTILVSPTTEFLFNFYVKDVRITIFERPSITENPSDDPTVSDAVNYTFLNNIAGFNATWDLNDVLLGFGYVNQIRYAINDEYANQNSVVNQVFANASFLLQPYLRVGLEGAASGTVYSQGESSQGEALNDNVNYSLGLFAMGNITRYTIWSAGVGWQIVSFSESNNSSNTGNASNPYFYLNVSNELNRYFRHSFNASFESAPSNESNFVQGLTLGYNFGWTVINNWSLGGGLFFETGTESPGPESEDFNRVGASLSLGYQVMKNMSANIYYNYIVKGSTVESDSYDQQILGLNLIYNF